LIEQKLYARGPYDRFNYSEQWIRLSEGCPNGCEYCRETKECGKEPIYFEIPSIIRTKVKILDMNLLYKPRALEIIKALGEKRAFNKVVHYELVCGIDFRYLTPELAQALKKSRFDNIRFAWDWGLDLQFKIKDCINILSLAGFRKSEISCFVICNWRISYQDCLRKLDLLKVWGVKINDCWFDNQLSPHIKPLFWSPEEIKDFRSKARKHNQLVRFGIDPELKRDPRFRKDPLKL